MSDGEPAVDADSRARLRRRGLRRSRPDPGVRAVEPRVWRSPSRACAIRTVKSGRLYTSCMIDLPRTAKGRATRARIVAAAAGLIGERGVAETSLDDVIERAAVSK